MGWPKEECRKYYLDLQQKLVDLREGQRTPPEMKRRPLRPKERMYWRRAVTSLWAMLNEECEACLPMLEAEEGPLGEFPRGTKVEPAEYNRRLKEKQRKETEKWARIEAEANAFQDFMWARLTLEETPAEAMAKLGKYAAKDEDAGKATIWQEVGRIDWEPAVQQVSQWMAESLQKFGAAQQADLVTINLGHSPEIFAVDALPWPGGQKKMAACLKSLREEPDCWNEEVDWDSSITLTYQKTAKLPGAVWKLFPSCTKKPRINYQAGMLIWDVIARLGVGRALRQKGVDWGALLGKRKRVPVVLGHEVPEYIGALTAQGWDAKR